jgi:transcriptional regulator of NAD metabolism
MQAQTRREAILNILQGSQAPVKGGLLSKAVGVSRQVIVGDIALLRAQGHRIIATPSGYMMLYEYAKKGVKKVVACKHHTNQQMRRELLTMVRHHCIVEDVIVEHPVYGEICAPLHIKSEQDVENFIQSLEETNSQPISLTTGGVHLHSLWADNPNDIEALLQALGALKLLVDDAPESDA